MDKYSASDDLCETHKVALKMEEVLNLVEENLPYMNADVLKKYMQKCMKPKKKRDPIAEAQAERAAKIAESKAALMKVNDSDHELSENHEPETLPDLKITEMIKEDSDENWAKNNKNNLCNPICEVKCINDKRLEVVNPDPQKFIYKTMQNGLKNMIVGHSFKNRSKYEVIETPIRPTWNSESGREKSCLRQAKCKSIKSCAERIYRPELGPEMIGVKQLGQLFELLAKVVDDREKVLAEEIFGYVQNTDIYTDCEFTIDTAIKVLAAWNNNDLRKIYHDDNDETNFTQNKLEIDECIFSLQKPKEYLKLVKRANPLKIAEAVEEWGNMFSKGTRKRKTSASMNKPIKTQKNSNNSKMVKK